MIGLDLDRPVPRAGKFPQPGSLEHAAAGLALDLLVGEVAAREPDTALGRRQAQGHKVAGPDAVEAARDGDATAARLIELWGERVGIGVAVKAGAPQPDIHDLAAHFASGSIKPRRKRSCVAPLTPPGAEPTLFFRELAREKQASTIFLFGHAPHLDGVIATALGSKKHLTSLKKAGVALIELKRISPPMGVLAWLATPKMLRRAGK